MSDAKPDPVPCLSPRAAVVLFTRALRCVEQIQPPTLREPVADMLAAGIEECSVVSSLLGRRVNHLLMLAQALIEACGSR